MPEHNSDQSSLLWRLFLKKIKSASFGMVNSHDQSTEEHLNPGSSDQKNLPDFGVAAAFPVHGKLV